MKHLSLICIVLAVLGCAEKKQQQTQNNEESNQPATINVDKAFKNAQAHFSNALNTYTDLDKIPRSIHNDGSVRFDTPTKWTSGFFPGSLWYLYEYTKDKKWEKAAAAWTENLDTVKNYPKTHDIGFIINCSYGNGLRLTDNKSYEEVIVQTAQTLSNRFDPDVGCTKSWDRYPFSEKWEFPVIIDNMMNMELLFKATELSGDSVFYNIAVSHAATTMKNHFRDDYSSYHVVDYDSITGEVIQKNTHQGYADSTSWARGQAWGLYGFTMTYRFTKNKRFLEHAKNIAKYIMNNPSTPDDNIPYWDYHDPDIPDAPRDASAAAIVASALLELQGYDEANKEAYINYATTILKSLSSKEYTAEEGTNNHFILKHCTGNYPEDSEIDKPLNYGDYYYLEALLRYNGLAK